MINFELMNKQLRALAEADASWLPVFANASALLWDCFPSINWAGFYIVNQGSLLLGPFQGKVACIRIPIGKGVCGTAVLEDATQRIDNVHLFPGHIACDSASNSELVIPIHHDDKVVALLDMDSPIYNRFSENDQKELESFVRALEEITEFSPISF
ncbi:GAF domain-containing protein [uncultured Megasphaera sp.]|uniref:GAF domain-containing protein n=1 Tax=uncultured Megasphaera sp. TaxID=165188 RepID=UPI0026339A94|nr:GAF domain-containing protein [uncultured Megasphaera sp.]